MPHDQGWQEVVWVQEEKQLLWAIREGLQRWVQLLILERWLEWEHYKLGNDAWMKPRSRDYQWCVKNSSSFERVSEIYEQRIIERVDQRWREPEEELERKVDQESAVSQSPGRRDSGKKDSQQDWLLLRDQEKKWGRVIGLAVRKSFWECSKEE